MEWFLFAAPVPRMLDDGIEPAEVFLSTLLGGLTAVMRGVRHFVVGSDAQTKPSYVLEIHKQPNRAA